MRMTNTQLEIYINSVYVIHCIRMTYPQLVRNIHQLCICMSYTVYVWQSSNSVKRSTSDSIHPKQMWSIAFWWPAAKIMLISTLYLYNLSTLKISITHTLYLYDDDSYAPSVWIISMISTSICVTNTLIDYDSYANRVWLIR